ncbi:hypothetical protein RSOL_061660, partial [Rhizoctonia solani AG-3 Rhs1AP]
MVLARLPEAPERHKDIINGSAAEPTINQASKDGPDHGDNESDDDEGLVDDIDEDKAEHDHTTVKASVIAAFSEVEKTFGIAISESDRQMAQQLLPKISGLANCAKNSPVVQHKFEQYVAAVPGLS